MIINTDFTKRYEKIPVDIFEESDAACLKVAKSIADTIKKREAKNLHTVLGLSAASSAIQVYEELAKLNKNKEVSFSNVHIFSVDEYWPLNKKELQSHYRFLKEYLLDFIEIPAENIHCLDSEVKKEDIHDYCISYEKKIHDLGGIDILIIGNMGFNEPGSHYNSRTRLITLNHNTRISAASEFFGVEYVPFHALTMGIETILMAKKIFFLAWGEGKAGTIAKLVEGTINEQNPTSYLQKHENLEVLVDYASAAELTRIKTPWLTGPCEWDEKLTRKAVFWLCKKLEKPILKLTDRDYNDNGMSDLITERGPASKINIKAFNDLQHTITGWPGGKPNADDSTRPERAFPFPKRAIIFSPHPDDDVISMGGTLARLAEHGHEVHLAYQVSGNIAVFDHDAIRFLDFIRDSSKIYGLDSELSSNIYKDALKELSVKHPGEPDSNQIRDVKGAIRRGEAKAACRYLRIPEERVHFLDMPFYETGGVKKNPIGPADIKIVKDLLQNVKPHQVYAAGDLSDPHGTHRVCLQAILSALNELKNEDWIKDCRVWLYRGAWQEWDVADADMAVPLSPEEVIIKREAIFKHQSQKDRPLFPGSDKREFWQRAEERNHNTAVLFDKLGMAEYQAIELFVRYNV
ncbi:MAG: glucosamine-6-phosphate deaminase [Bacteroidetes bacterium GWE2_39_28]|nr:MAG: glucosamine-6-phosphate deaminase [Bacteroidetes bacterium GWE2_39_28]OFY14074.1 MAG: glucosamine-6-phosphate deaminase [Bacteroidetes bacterium GWF2_39_10]OFZ07870.1 MAG: glucosamine-6-phosphate deaminase [Bacteroidetes bacterium RIFOXYB2_FULL_39_7]OFZ10786.1 MAG: glucosamine-6-phosphate deaminase [Bacteroidetes bacterium RIFOXYC2_FULL_39_11]HCT94013.1 glucosamine-6-phosphate deaminase [Rikenellaceae bacterium]